MHHTQEHTLLQKIREGDGTAFRDLYDLYHAALYRNVIKLVQSPTEAQDIIQEVFISLWEHRETLDISRPVNSWLFTVSYNRTVNHLKKKTQDQQKTRLITELVHENADQQEDEKLIEAQWRLMHEAIDKLSPQKRKVFQLCKLEGKTYEKAAQELGISRNTVGEYLQEAMAFIKEYVRSHPYYASSSLAIFVLEIFFQ